MNWWSLNKNSIFQKKTEAVLTNAPKWNGWISILLTNQCRELHNNSKVKIFYFWINISSLMRPELDLKNSIVCAPIEPSSAFRAPFYRFQPSQLAWRATKTTGGWKKSTRWLVGATLFFTRNEMNFCRKTRRRWRSSGKWSTSQPTAPHRTTSHPPTRRKSERQTDWMEVAMEQEDDNKDRLSLVCATACPKRRRDSVRIPQPSISSHPIPSFSPAVARLRVVGMLTM